MSSAGEWPRCAVFVVCQLGGDRRIADESVRNAVGDKLMLWVRPITLR